MTILIQILKTVLMGLLTSAATQRFIKDLVIHLLEKLAARTDNKVDDELVATVKAALESPVTE